MKKPCNCGAGAVALRVLPAPANGGLPLVAFLMPVLLLAPAAPSTAQEAWTATSTTNAPTALALHTAVWTGAKMVVWGGYDGSGAANTGGIHDPASDTWTATSTTNAPSERYWHTAAWTGAKMIVWGGYDGNNFDLATGGIYEPGTDKWTATSTTNAPWARHEHSAVWTGSRMIVWGGYRKTWFPPYGTGGIYDPATDTWAATSMTNAPTGRRWHTAVWTGAKMVVWGGLRDGEGVPTTGGIYDPATGTWTATSTTNAPAGRWMHTAVWTGSKMVVWGGDDGWGGANTGGIYDPATDTWTATSTTNAPTGRIWHTAVWTGSKMVIWGGADGSGPLNTGGIYDPATDTWTATSTTNAPTGRNWHTAAWTGAKMVVWGGEGSGNPVNTGGLYSNPAVLPPPPPPADLFTVTPCRLVDTRSPAGALGGPALEANTSRAFVVVGSCGIPRAADAVAINVTVVSPTAGGHLRLLASGIPSTGTSSLNYAANQTRANNAVVALGADGAFVVYVSQPSGTTHLVVDVTGYFGAAGCSPARTPASPGLTIDTGARTLTWPPVPGATSYDVYVKAVGGDCGLLGPQSVTRSDLKLSNVSSPLDVSSFDRCGTCYFVDASTLSGTCESRLRSDEGQPAPLGFSLLPCSQWHVQRQRWERTWVSRPMSRLAEGK